MGTSVSPCLASLNPAAPATPGPASALASPFAVVTGAQPSAAAGPNARGFQLSTSQLSLSAFYHWNPETTKRNPTKSADGELKGGGV